MTILGQAVDGIVEVQDEGTALPFAHALNFVGAGVTITLDAAAGRYLVTIPAGGVTDHGALTGLGDDDHPQYETSAEAQAKVDTHAAAADPHTGYQKESEKAAASGYAGLDAATKVPTAQLGGAGADATKFLRGDQTWQVPAGGGFNHAPVGALYPGVLSIGVKSPQVPYKGTAWTAVTLYCRVTVAPQTTAITVEIRRNGTSLGTVTIAAAAQTGAATISAAIADGDYFDINITATGTTPNEGSDLVWTVAP